MSVLTASPTVRPRGAATTGPGASALLVGGPLAMAFHVLWSIGHGPTVVNEHGVVLGLTNDQWSWLSPAWMALVAVGVVTVGRLHTDGLSRTGVRLVLAGLLLSALATVVFVLFSIGLLLLNAGLLCLGSAVLRARILPWWSGVGLLGAVATFVPLLVAPATFIDAAVIVGPVLLQAENVLAAATTLGWTLLGAGLLLGCPEARRS